ncbi:MAG: 50S ribosomal protein L19, partial [Planctomycetota bacterium]
HSPNVEKVVVQRGGKVRRAKLYYLRDRVGKATRLAEKKTDTVSKKQAAKAAATEAPVENAA